MRPPVVTHAALNYKKFIAIKRTDNTEQNTA